MLAHYELAKPALKRAKNQAAKEERDVLFIERILKFLKPGGRAAIVLPQGKFNNSSLAFIREWILRKARLLAVVGLHQNTFKPHTGTKTSVLFIQKYTEEELIKIREVKQQVAADCPDYETLIRNIIDQYAQEIDIPDEDIPEDILEALLENFGQGETEVLEEDIHDEPGDEDEVEDTPELEELLEIAEVRIRELRTELVQTKTKYDDQDSDLEALNQKRDQEIVVIKENWEGLNKDLNALIREIRARYREETKNLKASQKESKKKLQANIKALETAVAEAEYKRKLLTNQGKLELALADDEIITSLIERWIDAEVAKRLDYPIFMAVSERGGKNNSGDYEYLTDEDGNLVEFGPEHSQEGQLVIDQDLVNYDLTHDELKNITIIQKKPFGIAEAFVRFAQNQKINFWEGEL